ncbi:uncharacterized protein LOC134710682 [Mytilus trossulus]|uniref:uncharacterized protein LOC134710682 n=1 Tax=Mytilus trossulus TaxID=6551 RepID=UPI0030056FBC
MVIQKVEHIHKSQDDIETFLEIACNLDKKLKSIEQSTCPKSFHTNIQQYIPRYKIETNSKAIEREIRVEIKAKYELDMLEITSITSDKDGRIWITDGRKQIRQLLVKDEIETIKSVETPHDIDEIRCLNKDVLFTSSSIPQIRFLAADDELKVFTDLSPNKPYTFHVSDNEIIVGLNCSSVRDKIDIPVIMRLGFNGKIIQIYKNHGRQLLTGDVVRSCSTTSDGAICYIDSIKIDGYTGDVLFISRDGIIQWKYSGNYFINSNEHPFTPIEVLSTGASNFIVSDTKQHALHILTAKEELVTIIDLTLMGLEEPRVMTTDVSGTLWIESKKLNKEILSRVKFSGF